MKHIIIIVALILIAFVSLGNAESMQEYSYSVDGLGTFSNSDTSTNYVLIKYINNGGSILYADIYINGGAFWYGDPAYADYYYRVVDLMGAPYYFCDRCKSTTCYSYHSKNVPVADYITAGVAGDASAFTVIATSVVIISDNPITTHYVTGTYACIDNVSLYIKDYADNYQKINYNDTSPFNFSISNNSEYRLSYSDGHNYDFECNGSNINYNYDACIKTWYHFKEGCGNLIPDSEGFYIEKIGDTVHAANYFHAPTGILTISESPADNIYISATPFSGQIGWFLDTIVNDTIYNLTNLNIDWSLKVIVQNESSGELINDAVVKVDQDCYCTDGYSIRQKITINGTVDFTDMSLQDASLFVMKSGYKIINENSTGYAAFLSGRVNFSSKTWIVKLAPSWSENVSTFYEVNNTVNIYFKDVNGNKTSKILDTDSEVYLYYENNNSNDESMTMRFESSSTHTYFMPEIQWSIPHGEIGHKTIANSYFTPWDYSYRATIYNSTIYGWNRTIPLTVRNATKETTEHYENLTTYLYFMGSSDGRIDYREDIQIGIHACSNNTTLMNVDIELYKNNSLLCYKNMTAGDFINADFPYWYMWSPIYDYESGANYSVRMFGFDRTLLETDYVECITDAITRKNKLTIIVKNRFGTNLDNAFVYLEEYGALPTGINYYASYEGLDNGYYRFKATKPGYEDVGWDDVTMSDSDEIRTYTLTESTSEAATANQPIKADDDELKNLYVMLMSFLLIFILFGGFLYVAK